LDQEPDDRRTLSAGAATVWYVGAVMPGQAATRASKRCTPTILARIAPLALLTLACLAACDDRAPLASASDTAAAPSAAYAPAPDDDELAGAPDPDRAGTDPAAGDQPIEYYRPAPPPSATRRTIEITLRSSPAGALVAVDGVVIGPTPAYWRGAVTGRAREFTFVKPDYAMARYRFVPVTSGVVHGTLKPLVRADHADAGAR
jgi:hypothetical protein